MPIAAALMAAPSAQAAELLSHPETVERTEVVRVDWTAEGAADAPEVVVERRYGLSWVTEEADVLLADAGDGAWSARWRPDYYTPSGTYRIQMEGADYALTSNQFGVRPCACVIPGQLRSNWRKRRFRLRVKAEYYSPPLAAFPALPTEVVTGRPLVRVYRDGRRIGSARLRYRRGAFRGSWNGRRGPQDSTVFELVSLRDAFGNG